MKKSITISLLLLAFALAGHAQATGDRYVAVAGGFSIRPPAGWRLEAKEGKKFKLAFGPASKVFMANLNFRDDVNAAGPKEYVTGSIDYLLENFKTIGATNTKLISRTDFVTDSGEGGEKIVYLTEFKGLQINTAQYYFSNGEKKLIVTFTALEAEKAGNDPVFDAAVKTLQLDH